MLAREASADAVSSPQTLFAMPVPAPWAGLNTAELPRWETGATSDVVLSYCSDTGAGSGKDGNGAQWITALVHIFRQHGISAFATTMLPPGTKSVEAKFSRQLKQCKILIVVLSFRAWGCSRAAVGAALTDRPQGTSRAGGA